MPALKLTDILFAKSLPRAFVKCSAAKTGNDFHVCPMLKLVVTKYHPEIVF